MRVVIAPDSFKESLTAREVAAAVRRGVEQVWPQADVVEMPLADGGEGTADALVAATGGRWVPVVVSGPQGTPVEAGFGLLGDGRTGVVELAAASGIDVALPQDRDVLTADTYGTGELIAAALDHGVTRLVIGLGGSATNDGGAGLLRALGAEVLDADGAPIAPGGAALAGARTLDVTGLDPRLAGVDIDVACDVDNPLTGPTGASAVFGPQKGAGPEDVALLDLALGQWADVVALGRSDLRDAPGAGAAGGAGFAAIAVLGGRMRPGIELVSDVVGLADVLAGSDLVITGEGRVDAQTMHGKTPAGVLDVARSAGVPVVVIAGSVGPGAEALLEAGAVAVVPTAPGPASTDELLADAAVNVERAARSVAALWQAAGRTLSG